MKLTISLSPNEILKLGQLTNLSFKNGWSPLIHTHDDIIFAIHRLIEISEAIDCDGNCEECKYYDECIMDDNDGLEGILY